MNIEKIATMTVKNEILKYSDFLEDFISENDKTPLYDGTIFVYNQNSKYKSKKDFNGKINVQVKGRQVRKLSKGNSKYRISIEDLIAYQKEKNGVLYFVVEMIDNTNTQIFYANLLPVDIYTLLKKALPKQKTITINIKPVKEKSSSSLKMICENFLKNSQKQLNLEIKNINELKNIKEIETEIVGEKEYIEDYLINNEVYSYAIDRENNRRYALTKLDNIQIFKEYKGIVRIRDKEFYKSITFVKNKTEHYILFGKSTKVYLSEPKFNFCAKGNIYERINDISFILDLIKYKEVYIKGKKYPSPLNMRSEKLNEFKKSLKDDLLNLIKIKENFDKFDLKFEISLEELDEISVRNLKLFIALNDGKKIEGLNSTNVKYISISKYRIAFLIIFQNDGSFEIYNYFSDLSGIMEVFYFDKDKNKIIISPYINLSEEDLCSCSNINFDVIKKTFEIREFSKETCERYNLWLLEVLKAYDKSKNIKLLNFAEFLINKIISFDYSEMYEINKMQIIKRKRALSKEEKEKLYIIKDNNEELAIQCAIAILLDNQSDFERYFNKMKEEEKEIFKKFPIYNLK